jgi:molybdopterin molybdotransferase
VKTNLLSVSEARETILNAVTPSTPLRIDPKDGLGFVLYEDIFSNFNLPGFDDSSMDGFAVKSEDILKASKQSPISLKIIEDIPAGTFPQKTIQHGQASRIMTGAPLPQGANAVVPVEYTNFSNRYSEKELPDTILVYKYVHSDDFIRPIGQDLHIGQKIFSKGHFLRPQDIGMLAGLGIEKIFVYPRIRIGLLSSGDEIIQPGEPLTPGKIYDINTPMLYSLLEQFGANVTKLGTAKDDYELAYQHFQKAENADIDLLVSSAGVSVGAYDPVRQIIQKHGKINFWRVNMRPGKPLAFGQYKNIPFIGLPGNPVSSFVTSCLFIKPLIFSWMGKTFSASSGEAVITESIESDGRESYMRTVIKNENGINSAFFPTHQGSGNIFSLVCANALLIIPAGVKSLPKGSKAKFIEI